MFGMRNLTFFFFLVVGQEHAMAGHLEQWGKFGAKSLPCMAGASQPCLFVIPLFDLGLYKDAFLTKFSKLHVNHYEKRILFICYAKKPHQ